MAERKKLASELRPASFRGVPFQVDASEPSFGRRVQVHEYPQRDKPYVEDLGRGTRDIPIIGFVVGEDYIAQAQALIGALEEAGPGTLSHPWLGEMRVSLRELARVSFNRELGQARIQMLFVESGELTFPSSEASTQAAARKAASKLEAASVQSFAERFGVKGFQDFVAAAASGNLGKMLGIVGLSDVGKALGFANSLTKTISTAIALISNPQSLGYTVMGAFGLSGLATTSAAWSNIARQLSRVGQSPSLKHKTSATASTAARRQINANTNAVSALSRQAMLVQAIGASSLVGSAVDTTARPTVAYQDMVGVRDDVLAAIDRELLVADDAVYEALMAARAAVWSDLTERARNSARLTTHQAPETVPALALAYDLYENAERDAELVSRNTIRHPGFVPPVPIRVLTR